MIERFSSRRGRLGGFLAQYLQGARRYDRIAGYFSSSIVEVAGESLESMASGSVVRVVCNSELSPLDVQTARAAKRAQYREWCASLPEHITPAMRDRLERLYNFLASGRLQVKVLPDSCFGLIHGKAGVVERSDGSCLAFIGSANESLRAWTLNYELVWTDQSTEGVAWVQEEFDALWSSPAAFDIADAVVQDVKRWTRRTVISAVEEWRNEYASDPASPVVELPIYRRENGLWAHQKAFVKRAFDSHVNGGARLVLADQVGLGKTIQLALAAKLMALWGTEPVLILAPRPLLTQWQDELWRLLSLPTAVWTGSRWLDEHGVQYPQQGIEALGRCPRRVGIVSTGLVVQSKDAAAQLLRLHYECVVVDEAHRARRRNLGGAYKEKDEKPEPNNLLRFLYEIAEKTRSLLLASATPVQLDPIEAWDLLDVLGRGGHHEVLGNAFSEWRKHPREGLAVVAGRVRPPAILADAWDWMRDPVPPAEEDRDFGQIRRALDLPDTDSWAKAVDLDRLSPPDRARVGRLARTFFENHNPYIRRIVRRTRTYLEDTADPATGEPYLPRVAVRLFGERLEQALALPPYLRAAYEAAEEFCDILGKRPGLSSGFLKTILLRRIGSTLVAGRDTARKMLGIDKGDDESEEEEDVETPAPTSSLYPLTPPEREALKRLLDLLAHQEDDPKGSAVESILLHGAEGTRPWIDEGCIVFSQYYDSVRWLAGRLSNSLTQEPIALYAGADRSGLIEAGVFTRLSRDVIKARVQSGEVRLILGTDAASEGLNLQCLGTLINLDLPWNPTRLEQRKGRIQRIGQTRAEIFVYNLRYRDSVEDRVHLLLSTRLQAIRDLFGQIPDTLEDVWILIAQHDEQKAREVIDRLPPQHPFEVRYDRIQQIDWEACTQVLDSASQLEKFRTGW